MASASTSNQMPADTTPGAVKVFGSVGLGNILQSWVSNHFGSGTKQALSGVDAVATGQKSALSLFGITPEQVFDLILIVLGVIMITFSVFSFSSKKIAIPTPAKVFT